MDINAADEDAIVRTVMGEAGNEPAMGKAAVAHVILNRLHSGDYGSSASKIVHAPGQFEPWQTRSKELSSYNPKSKDYQSTKAIVDDVLSGKIADPTGGATHFLAPAIMRARGTPNPDWAGGTPVARIGGHSFYAPNGPVAPDLLGSLVKSYDTAPAPSQASGPEPEAEDLLGKLVKSYEPAPQQQPAPTENGQPRLPIYPEGSGNKVSSTNPGIGGSDISSTDYPMLNNAAAGFGHGVMEVVNTGAQGIGYLTNHITKFLADRGIMSPEDVTTAQNRYDILNQRIAAENQNYEKNYGDSYAAYGGQIAGNLLATAPLLMTGEGAVGAGINALTRASPTAARIAYGLGNSTLARFGLLAPAEGALSGAEISGATSSGNNAPVGQQITQGAETGALLGPVGPALVGTGRYLGNALGSVVAPFTESGRTKIANSFLSDRGNNALATNSHEIVPGSVPTLAEATGNANIATVQRAARDLNPTPFTERETQNAQARTAHLNRVMGTPQDVDAAQASLDAQADHAVHTIFKPGQVVDTAPVVAEIDGILSGPGGKRTAVQGALTKLRTKLVNKDGSLESDPETVYNSVRKEIGDMLTGKSDSKADQAASRELINVRNVLDDRMTKAVPGFDNYINDYSAAAKPIDAMRYLQGLRLTDAQGNMTLAKVKSALEGIAKQRQAKGINPAKSLSQGQIDALQDIHDDLFRQANLGKGRSIGSNTVQNIATQNLLGGVLGNRLGGLVGHVDPKLIGSGVGAGVGSLAGPWGAVVGAGLGTTAGHVASDAVKGTNALVQQQLEDILLNPHKFVPAQGGQNLPVERLRINRLLAPAGVAARNALAPTDH